MLNLLRAPLRVLENSMGFARHGKSRLRPFSVPALHKKCKAVALPCAIA